MTALDQFSRIEAIAQWSQGDAPAREVVVKFGDARLTICDMADAPLTQWSIAAILMREEPDGKITLSPEDGFGETLSVENGVLVEAIRKVHAGSNGTDTSARRWGRRGLWTLGAAAVLAAMIWLSLPALTAALTARIPPQTWERLSTLVLAQERGGARICARAPDRALRQIATRLSLDPARLMVAQGYGGQVFVVPDGRVLIPSSLLIQSNSPDVPAAALAEAISRTDLKLPRTVARDMGWMALRLVLNGTPGPQDAEMLRTALHTLPQSEESDARFATMMETAGLPTTPYADFLIGQGRDLRAQTVASLDRIGAAAYQPAARDNDWVALQAACTAP
ncbi:hypothetical protein FHS89_002104 [Rubricella aquisinus]|uniref:Uncharacterized protein n=1 Tax=Rubricella aquisinus TaxID=2028108 RepID=A0A840WLW3_9RHOB|nr:hypothetical protein [Rubricella aquisinus]MBB5516078.1 hypothetical protein [Rubricella aquisinus]